MDMEDRHRFVQLYVEQQKAYLPTYTAEPSDEQHGTPSKPSPQIDGFGFDTPVLRPRVPANKVPSSQRTPPAGPSKSRKRKGEADPLTKQVRVPSQLKDSDPGKKKSTGKDSNKRAKASTPIDADDSERAASRSRSHASERAFDESMYPGLADRRERKRKKRAIVNPRQKHYEEDIAHATPPKKGSQKAKKPAALALLYGFSATNVTKDRLTLKPPPSFGVFNKGKASAKKKVSTIRRTTKTNENFSELAFLNNLNEQTDGRSKRDNNSDNGSISSISNHSASQNRRVVKSKKDRFKGRSLASQTSQASVRKRAESEVWEIELQSKLFSSASNVSSELDDKESAPVVLDPCRAEWSAFINVSEGREQCGSKAQTLSVTGDRLEAVRSSPQARSDLRTGTGIPDAADVPSIHPSHSVSQAGRCSVSEMRLSDLWLVTSKYFTEPEADGMQDLPGIPDVPQKSRPNDGFAVYDPVIQNTAAVAHATPRVASPMNSLIGAPLPMVEFQTRYDMAPLELPSDESPYGDWCGPVDAAWEVPGGACHGYAESCAREPGGERVNGISEHQYACQGGGSDWYRSWSPLVDEAGYQQGTDHGPLAEEYKDEPYDPEPAYFSEAQPDHDERVSEAGYCPDETGEICDFEDELYEVSGADVPGFLEGRALLFGVPEDDEWRRTAGMSGLVQAEMDVASRLRRNHWRPLRL